MAKQIIILNTERGPGGDRALTAVFWFPIPLARRVPRPGATSAFDGATAEELAEIQSGAVIEQTFSTQVPIGATTAQVKAALESEYGRRATAIAALLNPRQFYGIFWAARLGAHKVNHGRH